MDEYCPTTRELRNRNITRIPIVDTKFGIQILADGRTGLRVHP